MNPQSIMLIGGPDSGKTNYLARLWKALQSGQGRLKSVEAPEIKYVEDALAHLLLGSFAPRSEKNIEEKRTETDGDWGRLLEKECTAMELENVLAGCQDTRQKKGSVNMNRKWIVLAFSIPMLAAGAAAQTVVTSTGTTATAGNTPYVSAATSTSTTLSPSPVSVSGANVGIGTASPSYPLDVNGFARLAKGVRIEPAASSGDTWNYYPNIVSYTGDGTDSGALEIQTDIGRASNEMFKIRVTTFTGASAGILKIENATSATGQYIPLDFQQYDGAPATARIAEYITSSGSYLGFGTSNNWSSGITNQAMTINYSGNVGIGTTSPSQLLEVNGTAQVDGVLNVSTAGIYFPANGSFPGGYQTLPYTGVTCGGDLAESVDVTGKRKTYEPGDVMVIDPDAPGKFLKSAEPYSTLVAGIYSTRPGTLGRRQTTPQSSDEVPMAMVGIVPTKVTAENGPIHTGDLLVSASTPGYAMKGTERNKMLGAVLGKALDSLNSGMGVIEVLVTLQ